MANEPITAEICFYSRSREVIEQNDAYLKQLARTIKGFRIDEKLGRKQIVKSLTPLGYRLYEDSPPFHLMWERMSILGKATVVYDVEFTGIKVLEKVKKILTNEKILFKIVMHKK